MSDSAHLPSLEIRGFRAFENLKVNEFAQVNLIVGKNNVGKSTLLDAIRVYAEGGHPAVLREILLSRGELALDDEESPRDELDRLFLAYARLFFGREDAYDPAKSIFIGPVGAPQKGLRIALGFYEGQDESGQLRLLDHSRYPLLTSGRPALVIGQNNQDTVIPLETTTRFFRHRIEADPRIEREAKTILVPPNGVTAGRIGALWDRIALTDLEEYVLEGLRLIAPDIERLSLVAAGERARVRTVVLKVSGFSRPVPLQSMGDGSNRMLGIVLALVNARNGILLIDEVENGIHYSVQPDLWRLVFASARRLNVQVFATSHSYDCIRAFQEAASRSDGVGLLVRLERQDGALRSVPFNERELDIATREQIEVR